MLISSCLALLVGAVSTSEVTLSSPQLKWLFGGFGFQNAEAQLGALMTDEFRDERALKCFRELDPSFARVYTGQWDASQAALDRFADYYDRTFRPAKTTIYATLFSQILERGATQHFAIAAGDVTAAVADLAHLLGIELSAC